MTQTIVQDEEQNGVVAVDGDMCNRRDVGGRIAKCTNGGSSDDSFCFLALPGTPRCDILDGSSNKT